jgi:hypothetical protein
MDNEEIALDVSVVPDQRPGILPTPSDDEAEVEAFEGKPIEELTQAEQIKLAKVILNTIDDDDTQIPLLPLNLNNTVVWSFENVMMPGPEEFEPGVIITLASQTDPRGTPYTLERDRGLKFCAQLKKRLMKGPDLVEEAERAGIAVPQKRLIVPGR